MLQFPTLKTGAVAQYPAAHSIQYRTDIVRFVDGSEQKLRNSPLFLLSWELSLDQLDEQELSTLAAFFASAQGAAASFSFTDPWTGLTYPSCSLDGDSFRAGYHAPLSGSTRLVIRQNRS